MRTRLGKDFGPAVGVMADQILHRHGGRGQAGVAQRQPANRADMVLELRAHRALDRPMPGIVHARGHFVEHRPLGPGKEFARQHTDIIELVGDPPGQCRRFAPVRGDLGGGGQGRSRQHAVFMLVPRRRIADHLSIATSGQED